jgi:hypothetical protein
MTNDENKITNTEEDLDTLIEIFEELNDWLDEREEKMKEQKRLLEEYENGNNYDRR